MGIATLTTNIKTYSDLIQLNTFEERLEYLKLSSNVGGVTLGSNRYMGQRFYNESPRWKTVREKAIIRDDSCDLAISGLYIIDRIFVHHINPLSIDDFLNDTDNMYDLENLICVSMSTHNAIHYGLTSKLLQYKDREPGDTILW